MGHWREPGGRPGRKLRGAVPESRASRGRGSPQKIREESREAAGQARKVVEQRREGWRVWELSRTDGGKGVGEREKQTQQIIRVLSHT